MKKIFFYSLVIFAVSFTANSAYGQSLQSIVKSTANHFSLLDLAGTWKYTGTAVKLESGNLLKKAGAKAISSNLEKNLDSQLSKIGLEAGATTFIFNSDSTFTNITGNKTLKGKYTYDNNTKYITLKYAGQIPLKAKLSGSGDKMSLLFEAKSFLSFTNLIGSQSGISAIESVGSILDSYNDMLVGMELIKE